ncbi:MAG: Mth938-like domain-containing protein [Deltaproteobacteria bacterium]|jgi:hypothetical protein
MDVTRQSPAITKLSWGRVEVAGLQQVYKDVKLFPGGARAWNWLETGTEHVPGVQPADVEELLEMGAEVIVFSRGMNGRLQVQPETLRLLEEKRIPYRVENTEQAVRIYNELRLQKTVGALIHSTC